MDQALDHAAFAAASLQQILAPGVVNWGQIPIYRSDDHL
jgi:hypothetical protein